MNHFRKELAAIKQEYDSGNSQRKTEKLVAEFKEKPVILYGAGTLCGFVMEKLSNFGISIECFADTYRSGIHRRTGLPIISAEQLKKEYDDALVIITSELYGKSIMETLKKIDYLGKIYSFDELLGLYAIPYEELAVHADGYEWAYEAYQDELSKKIVVDSIRTRLFGTEMTASQNPQYFEPDIFTLSDSEVFVDGGAFIGDTAEEFIKQTHGKYKHIYGFEPDENNLKKAVANLAQYKDIDIAHGGLWHMTNTARFASGNFGNSQIAKEGDVFVRTYGLDDYFAEKSDIPTFVKMDIEGAELAAINGAERLLKTHKPKLAICVYHQLPDMYVLPQRILYHNPEYKLALRHYSRWYAESVCYAI